MSSIASVHTQPSKPQGCCDQISMAFGKCWTWIVNAWRWCVDKVFRVVDAIAWSFFRFVGCFSPNLAKNMEIGYGYLATWYARHTAAADKKIAQTAIEDLEKVNRDLNASVLQGSNELSTLKVVHAQKVSESKRLAEERNRDIQAKSLLQGECKRMQKMSALMHAKAQALELENRRVQGRLQTYIEARAPLLTERDSLADELGIAQFHNQRLQMRLDYRTNERDIAFGFIQLLDACQEAQANKIQQSIPLKNFARIK